MRPTFLCGKDVYLETKFPRNMGLGIVTQTRTRMGMSTPLFEIGNLVMPGVL